MPALAELALTATITAADAWRTSSARWERRAEVCLAHLEARSADHADCELVRQVADAAAAPVTVRPWPWWAGGAAAGLGVGIAGTAVVACPDQACARVAGIVGIVSLVVGLALSVLP